MSRPAFLDQEAPPGYVAGVGRGATGFTTSADTGAVRIEDGIDDDEKIDTNNDDSGLLARRGNVDEVDEEAEKIYEDIEHRLQQKNRKKKDQLVEKTEPDHHQTQFLDLKRDLSQVSIDQWAALPEAGDLTRRNKRTRLLEKQQQRFYSVPDSVLSSLSSPQTNFASISQGKDKILSQRLDELLPQQTDSNNTIDEQDFNVDSQVADANRTRLVLNSLRRTAPNKSSSWIASIRVEEQAKNYAAAKRLAVEACQKVPQSEDVWLESIRVHEKSLQSSYECKNIAQSGLRMNPTSLSLWLKLYDLEASSDDLTKRKILMRALEKLPHEAILWKRLVQLEHDKSEVRKLLLKAVELCPSDWSLRHKLLEYSDHKAGKAILNEARKLIPGEPRLWTSALEFEEKNNPDVLESKLVSMMKRGLDEVLKANTDFHPLDFVEFAKSAEEGAHHKTCHAIIQAAFSVSDTNLDLSLWVEKAQDVAHKNTAQAIFGAVIEKFPNNVDTWLLLFESSRLDLPKLIQHYKKAIQLNPEEELFRLMYAKDLWLLMNDIKGARRALESANRVLPDSEEIWIAMTKLEIRTNQYELAESIFARAISSIGKFSSRIWYKYIHYQRFRFYQKEILSEKLLECIEEAIDNFPENQRLHLQRGQILMLDINDIEKARVFLSHSVKFCPRSIAIWKAYADLEEFFFKNILKARSILDLGLLKNPESDLLWVLKVLLELRAGDKNSASQICSRALQKFPNSPLLWVQSLNLINKQSQKKNAFLDALKKTNNAPEVLVEIGKSFFTEGKYAKAEQWFQRGVDSEVAYGESWAWLLKALEKTGKVERIAELQKTVEINFDEINRGEIWIKCKKDPKNLTASANEVLRAAVKLI